MLDLRTILSYSRKHDSRGEDKFIALLLELLQEADGSIHVDAGCNIWFETNSPKQSPFLFVAHLDTCHKVDDEYVEVEQDEYGYLQLKNKEVGCLGADDGVGIYVLLRMIEAGVKGTFLFTRGEEKGLIGATYIAMNKSHLLDQFLICVEVDREGTSEIIIEQTTGKCASVEFGEALAIALDMGHKVSYNGIYTDNSMFNDSIPECVNIAAGYSRQHTSKERVKHQYVLQLAEAMCLLDWASLPIMRDTSDVTSYIDWGQHRSYDTSGTYVRYNGGEMEYMGCHYGDNWTMEEIAEDNVCMTKAEARQFIAEFPDLVAHYLYSQGITAAEMYEEWANGSLLL